MAPAPSPSRSNLPTIEHSAQKNTNMKICPRNTAKSIFYDRENAHHSFLPITQVVSETQPLKLHSAKTPHFPDNTNPFPQSTRPRKTSKKRKLQNYHHNPKRIRVRSLQKSAFSGICNSTEISIEGLQKYFFLYLRIPTRVNKRQPRPVATTVPYLLRGNYEP